MWQSISFKIKVGSGEYDYVVLTNHVKEKRPGIQRKVKLIEDMFGFAVVHFFPPHNTTAALTALSGVKKTGIPMDVKAEAISLLNLPPGEQMRTGFSQ